MNSLDVSTFKDIFSLTRFADRVWVRAGAWHGTLLPYEHPVQKQGEEEEENYAEFLRTFKMCMNNEEGLNMNFTDTE